MTYITDLDAFFLLDHFSRHPWGCVEALKPFLGPFFPRKLLINMLVTLIGENSASESTVQSKILLFLASTLLGVGGVSGSDMMYSSNVFLKLSGELHSFTALGRLLNSLGPIDVKILWFLWIDSRRVVSSAPQEVPGR